jgi:hypothetical protein
LRIEETSRENLVPVTASELPSEARTSAVSPILRAYRHHEGAPALGLSVTRLPEQDLEEGAIHSIEATSVLAAEGKLVTELRISLRNASRPSLAVRLPPETELRSAFLDGEPVRPSRDESGLLLLPLARSHGEDHDEPMVLEILLESAVAPQGLFGAAKLELPTLDLDAASLKWTMYLPARNDYGDIRARLSGQTYAGSVSWHKPPHIKRAVRWNEDEGKDKRAATSHSPTWSELALSSTEKVHARYWINAGEAVRVEIPFVRSYLLLPFRGLIGIVVLLPIVFLARRRRVFPWFVTAFQSLRTRVPSRVFSWVRRQAWTRRRAGRALSLVLGSAVVLWLFVDRFGCLAKIVAGLIGGDA